MSVRIAIPALLSALLLLSSVRSAEIELIGKGNIPGTARDKSGLKSAPGDKTPADLLGTFGSCIAYTGADNRYILVNDSGPKGVARWNCRFHTFEIVGDPKARSVKATLLATTLLRNEKEQELVGQGKEFDKTNSPAGLRFDPEGVRVGRTGTIFISDEFGPFVYEFDRAGKRLRAFDIPGKFLISKPGATAEQEQPPHNTSGRTPNKGFEGLAISPDGSKLYAMLQSPLLQDRVGATAAKAGRNLRILELQVAQGKPRELLYPLEAQSNGCNEILAIDDTRFLVIERDGKGGDEARFKKLVLIDIKDASDISGLAALPEKEIPKDVRPVSKKTFLNLLDPAFGLVGPQFPAKIEGIAFGPDLPDGRILLLVTSDNDCKLDEPTWIYAFAIDRKALPGYKPQQFEGK